MSAIKPHSNRERSRSSSAGNLVRWVVTAENDLFLRIVQGVKCVEKLRLGALFSRNKLDVIDQEDVNRPVSLSKVENPIVTKRVDHLVHEALRGDVGQLERRVMLEHVLTNRVHEVRLAEPHPTIDEERVIGTRRCLRHRPAGRVCELVGWTRR